MEFFGLYLRGVPGLPELCSSLKLGGEVLLSWFDKVWESLFFPPLDQGSVVDPSPPESDMEDFRMALPLLEDEELLALP